MNNVLISIITPTYNSEATVQACIDSVAQQTYRPIEHLFIDGLSTDNTVEIIEAACRKYPHIRLISEKDDGIYDAMNKAMALAHGDYFYFLGSDDRLFQTTTLTELFGDVDEPGHAVIYGNVKVSGGDMKWAREGAVYDGAFTFEKLLQRNICHQAMFYPRSLVLRAGLYNPSYKVTADWDYNLRAFSLAPFQYKNVTVAYYNTTGLSGMRPDIGFKYAFADELRKYYKASLFDRRFKGAYEAFADGGFMRLRAHELSGLMHLLAAVYQQPSYLWEILCTFGRGLRNRLKPG